LTGDWGPSYTAFSTLNNRVLTRKGMNSTLTPRQATILDSLIRLHVDTAQPVGSSAIAEKDGIVASAATIRNEMAELEEMGYLKSPHTSAGRVPTEAAYRYYVKNSTTPLSMPQVEERRFREIEQHYHELDVRIRQIAKAVAEFSAEGVFLAFGKDDLYYTGLSNLFAQPEFREQQDLVEMGQVIDHLDEAIARVFGTNSDDSVTVLLGSENPFGSNCGVILVRCAVANGGDGVFGILGPTRMDYRTNIARVERVRNCVSQP